MASRSAKLDKAIEAFERGAPFFGGVGEPSPALRIVSLGELIGAATP